MQQQRSSTGFQTWLLAGILLSSVLLLSACNSVSGTNSSSLFSSPAIGSTLKNQGDTQLQTFQQWITLMKGSGADVKQYQQQYDADQQTLQEATSSESYQKALNKLNTHIQDIKIPALQAEDKMLQKELSDQVADWEKQHPYYNAYDKTTYHLGYEYGNIGIESWAQDDLDNAKTLADYQQAIENLKMYLYNFQTMKTNSGDKTPYNQVHQNDLQLIKHYGIENSKVVVVSLYEQAMRIYENGKLVKSFLVTTGRPDRPTPPGVWWVEGKQAPTVFKSGVPEGSPDYYPDTPINYAMQYHSSGYFIHDSWWRADYDPGTNFPHADSSGDSFSSQGSHGCVNLSKVNAGWVYDFVDLYTKIVIY